jgi:hypothetical protein
MIHCIETYSGQENIYPLLDACMIAELRALLFGKKTSIVEPVYEVPMRTGGGTLAEVNARRGYPEEEDAFPEEHDLESRIARAEAYGVDR